MGKNIGTTPPTIPKPHAVVITYHPDAQTSERLALLAGQVSCLMIVDNGSNVQEVTQLTVFTRAHEHVHLVLNEQNLGIATALNQGVRFAQEQGAQWVLTMDQDSVVEPDFVEHLMATLAGCPCERVGILAANYTDSNGIIHDRSDVQKQGCHQVQTAITSGSLLNIQAWSQINGFREELFIDLVDHDLCFRLKKAGWGLFLTYRPLMRHSLGHPHVVPFLRGKIIISNYPPVRHYYMMRNSIAIFKAHFFSETKWVILKMVQIIFNALLVVCFESNKWQKIKAILQGVYHGLIGKLGPRPM